MSGAVKVKVAPLYVDLPTVAALVSLSEASIQNLVREDAFPKSRLLSGRRVGWLLREVNEWAEARPHSSLPPPPNTGAKKGQRSISGEPPASQGRSIAS